MKYWEIIAEELRKHGWVCTHTSIFDPNRGRVYVVSARRSDGGTRRVAQADELLTAFMELQNQCRMSELGKLLHAGSTN